MVKNDVVSARYAKVGSLNKVLPPDFQCVIRYYSKNPLSIYLERVLSVIKKEIFMKLKTVASIIIVVLVVFGLALIASRGSGPHSSISTTNNNNTNNSSNNTQANPPGSTNTSMLFSDQPYAPYSYLIYPGTPSPQSQAALSGFSMSTTQLQNGSARITLTFISTGDNQTMILKQGYKLYFIETSFGDDAFGGESSLGDDGYVIVNPNGYVS
jgi:hypothetical protein